MTTAAQTKTGSKDVLARKLGTFNAVTLVVGIVIGSGIFAVPGSVAAVAKNVGPFLLGWVIAGVSVLFMALVYTELAPMIPKAVEATPILRQPSASRSVLRMVGLKRLGPMQRSSDCWRCHLQIMSDTLLASRPLRQKLLALLWSPS